MVTPPAQPALRCQRKVQGAVGLLHQRFLDPTLFVPALAESFAIEADACASRQRFVLCVTRGALSTCSIARRAPKGTVVRHRRPLHRRLVEHVGESLRRSRAGPCWTWLQLQRAHRRTHRRPGLPARPAPRLHSDEGPTPPRRDDGVPATERAAGSAPDSRHGRGCALDARQRRCRRPHRGVGRPPTGDRRRDAVGRSHWLAQSVVRRRSRDGGHGARTRHRAACRSRHRGGTHTKALSCVQPVALSSRISPHVAPIEVGLVPLASAQNALCGTPVQGADRSHRPRLVGRLAVVEQVLADHGMDGTGRGRRSAVPGHLEQRPKHGNGGRLRRPSRRDVLRGPHRGRLPVRDHGHHVRPCGPLSEPSIGS